MEEEIKCNQEKYQNEPLKQKIKSQIRSTEIQLKMLTKNNLEQSIVQIGINMTSNDKTHGSRNKNFYKKQHR